MAGVLLLVLLCALVYLVTVALTGSAILALILAIVVALAGFQRVR